MKKLILIITLFTLYAGQLTAQNKNTWEKKSYGRGTGFLEATNGNYIAAQNYNDGTASVLIYSSEREYLTKFKSAKGDYTFLYDVIETSDKNYVAVGEHRGGDDQKTDFYICKVSKEGNLIYEKKYSLTPKYDRAYSVAELPDESLILVGMAGKEKNRDWRKAAILKLDKNGKELDRKLYEKYNVNEYNSVTATKDGNFVVVGRDGYDPAKKHTDILIQKYDGELNELWKVNKGKAYMDEAESVIEDTEGNLVVTGYTSIRWNTSTYVIKLDAKGKTIWEKEYSVGNKDKGVALTQTKDKNYVIMGTYSNAIRILKIKPNGEKISDKNHVLKTRRFLVEDIEATSDGGYVLCGFIRTEYGGYETFIRKF